MQDKVRVECAAGMEFQIDGAQTLKARWPVDMRTRGCSSNNWSDLDSDQDGSHSAAVC